MRINRRAAIRSTLAGFAGGFLAACAGDESSGTPAPATTVSPSAPPAHPGGTLRWRQPAALQSLDPHTGGFGTGFAASLIYDSPFRVRASADPGVQEIEPHLAASFEQPEPTVLVLRLASGAHFDESQPTGGRRVTAEDVVFSLRRVSGGQPDFVHSGLFTPIQDIEAAGEGLVRLRLREPSAPLLRYLATPWAAIVAREVLELRGSLERAAAGTGPFRLRSVAGDRLSLDRNPSWWRESGAGGLPNLDAIEMDPLPGAGERLDALLAGETDWAPFVPFDRAAELDGREGITTAAYALQDFQHVRLRTTLGPLRDVRVRRALAFATDRTRLIGQAYGGRGVPHLVLPQSVVPWAAPADALPYHRYDPEQARQLLAAAGVEGELRLTNLAPRDTPLQNEVARALATQWSAVGVAMTDQALPYREYLDRIGAGNFEVNVHWGNRYDDLDGYVSEFEATSPRNFGGWGDPEVDALIAGQRTLLDPAARLDKAVEIQTALAENAWAIGTASWLNTDAWLAGLRDSAASAEPYAQTRLLSDASLSV